MSADDPRPSVTGRVEPAPDEAVGPGDPLPRPPRPRRDPAAMRQTLDDARRRLGRARPMSEAPPSAERLRALLREAANQAAPLDPGPPTALPSPSPGAVEAPGPTDPLG